MSNIELSLKDKSVPYTISDKIKRICSYVFSNILRYF